MVTDIIADSLARINNALQRQKDEVTLEYSKMIMSICEILKKQEYIVDYSMQEDGVFKSIQVVLTNAEKAKNPVAKNITSLKRISKGGVRVYKSYKQLRPVLNGYGIAIISTSKGVVTDIEARKLKAGGEVLCEIY